MAETETAEKGATNEEMIDKVRMICKVCGGVVAYNIEDSCPNCGFISLSCTTCKYKYSFGE